MHFKRINNYRYIINNYRYIIMRIFFFVSCSYFFMLQVSSVLRTGFLKATIYNIL